jgi:hypothetical protein
MHEKRAAPTILTPGAVERLLADQQRRSPRRLILAGRELFRDDLLIGTEAVVIQTTRTRVVLRYMDPAHPSASPVTHTIPRTLLTMRRTAPANARRPEPLAPRPAPGPGQRIRQEGG